MAEEKKEQATTKLKLGPQDWRTTTFDPSIEGVPVIDKEGVDVPSDKVEEVKEKAKANNLAIREVKEGS